MYMLPLARPQSPRYGCDQYRWVTKGVYTIKCGVYEVKKRSNTIDSDQSPQGVGDMQFR